MILPTELIEKIYGYLPLEKVVHLSQRIADELYEPNVHTWEKAIDDENDEVFLDFLDKKKEEYEFSHDLMEDVTINGNFEQIRWFYMNKKKFLTNDLTGIILSNKNYDVLEWIFDNHIIDASVDINSLHDDDVEVLKWLSQHKFQFSEQLLYIVIKNSMYDCLRWLYKNHNEIFFNKDVIRNASVHCDFKTLSYLYEVCNFKDFTSIHMEYAVANNRLESCIFFHKRGVKSTPRCFDWAVKNENFNMIRWLYDYNYAGCTYLSMEYAVEAENMELINFLHNISAQCDMKVLRLASRKGNLHIVKWLHDHYDDLFNSDVVDCSFESGNIELAKWFLEDSLMDCSNIAIDIAAEHGHLEMVKWLHEKKPLCCTEEAIDLACQNYRTEIVKWLLENRDDGFTSEAVNFAALNGDLELLKILVQADPSKLTIDAIDIAAEHNNLDVVKLLHEEMNIRMTSEGFNLACENGHFELVKWIEQTYGSLNVDAVEASLKYNNVNIALWLLDRGYKIGFLGLQEIVANRNLNMLKHCYKKEYMPCDITNEMLMALANIALSNHDYKILEFLNSIALEREKKNKKYIKSKKQKKI